MQCCCNDAVILHLVSESVKKDLRAARRAETEARLVAAATELFLEQGYAATTLVQVARRAGLAERTVYVRFATKAAVLVRCLEVAIEGGSEGGAVADSDGFAAAMAASTIEERVRLMAGISAGLMERTGPLLEVAQQAEASEAAIASMAQAARGDTRRALTGFVNAMSADGLLPPDANLDWLAETVAIVGQAETYLLLAKTTGWNVAAYRDWLAATWSRLIAGSSA